MNKLVNLKKDIKKELISTIFFAVLFVVSIFSSITSFAQTLPFNINDAKIVEKSPDTVGNIQKINRDELINDITFHKVNDYVIYKINIKSNIKKQITILSISDDNENEYIEYEYDKHENEKVNAQSSFDFIVKATYKKELVDITKRNQTNNVKFIIKYLEDNNEKEGEIVINPKTGDNIYKNYIMLFISSVGLIISIVLYKNRKRNSKKLSKLALFIITGLMFTPIIAKAATIVFNVSLKTDIYLRDKVIVTYVVGDQEKTIVKNYKDKITELEAPEKEGYTFSKWVYEDGSDYNLNNSVIDDIKIFAQYSANNYSVVFDRNNGTGEMTNQEMTYDNKANLTKNTFERTGYNFKGWNTKADGSGTSYDDEAEVQNLVTSGNIKLYAMWELNIKVGDIVNYKAFRGSNGNALNLNYKYCVPYFDTDAETGDVALRDPMDCNENAKHVDFNSNDGVVWRVLNIDSETGKIELIGTNIYHKIPIFGETKFENYMNIMNGIADVYGHGYGAENSRMISIKDIEKYSSYNPENYEGGPALTRYNWYSLEPNVYPYGEKKLFENSYLYRENLNDDGVVEGYTGGMEYFEQYNATSTFYEYNARNYINNDEIYKLLFLNDNNSYKSYWLANQTGIIESYGETDHMMYGARIVDKGMVTGSYYNFDDYYYWESEEHLNKTDNLSVAPIVTLSSNVNLVYDEGRDLWNIGETENSSYKIIFDGSAEDVSGTMSSQIVNYGEKVNLNKNQYSLYGYDFIGWSIEKNKIGSGYKYDSSVVDFADEQEIKNLSVSGNITLYAVFTPHVTVIKFNKNDENATGEIRERYCYIPEQSKCADDISDFKFNNNGYVFNGWNTKADGTGISYKMEKHFDNYYHFYESNMESLANIDEMTLYAQWKEDIIGDTVNYSVTVNENQTLDNWKIFDFDDDGYTYLIYGDYLPTSAVPQSLIDSYKLGISGEYAVYGKNSRDNFISNLNNSDNWSYLISTELNNAAERINKTATATGTPTMIQYLNSWNKKYTSESIDINGDEDSGYYYTFIESRSGYNNILYVPHKEIYENVSGFWFASKTIGYDKVTNPVSLSYDGDLNYHYYGYASTSRAIRPIIRIPSSLLARNNDGESWDINYSN